MGERTDNPPNGKREGHLRTYISREGMGLHYTVKVGNVIVWTHAFAMDGPINPEVEKLFLLLHEFGEEFR